MHSLKRMRSRSPAQHTDQPVADLPRHEASRSARRESGKGLTQAAITSLRLAT